MKMNSVAFVLFIRKGFKAKQCGKIKPNFSSFMILLSLASSSFFSITVGSFFSSDLIPAAYVIGLPSDLAL